MRVFIVCGKKYYSKQHCHIFGLYLLFFQNYFLKSKRLVISQSICWSLSSFEVLNSWREDPETTKSSKTAVNKFIFALFASYCYIQAHLKIKSFFITNITQPNSKNQITIIIQNTCKINRWKFYSSCAPRFLQNLHLKRLLPLGKCRSYD